MLFLPKQKNIFFFVLSAFFCILVSNNDPAKASVLPENPEEIAWHISALKVTFDNKKNLYIARGDVIITGGKTRLEADYVEFSNKTKDAFAQGNVILISGQDSISCDAMKINLITETGTINKGTIFIQEKNFYIHGENIRKTGKFSYSTDKGSITSCSGESPDWKITGRDIKVTIEGYGHAKHAVFWAKKIPAVYTPFLVFPAKTKRQTGFLVPTAGSSDRKGFEYEQPLFLAISRNTDATVYIDHMTDRGTKLGTEYRYALDNNTKGVMAFDFLEDDKIDDGTKDSEQYSFSSTPQRSNTDRFWFRMKHNHDLGQGFTAKLDIDIASDEDYLHEFKDGHTGYNKANNYFEEEFGRGLDEYDDYVRKNQLNINKSWSYYTFNTDVLWFDNIRARRQDKDDTTLQTLPGIEFDAFRNQIGASKFFYSLDSEYRSFYRQDTTDEKVKGQRADIYPKVYLPLKLGKYFNFEPSAGVRQTLWHTNEFTDINGNSDNFRTREMYDIGSKLSTKIIKIFNPETKFADKIQHEIIPKLEYAFTPNIIQNDLPSFDDLDRIEEQNLLTWSFTNNFTLRKSRINSKGEEVFTYREFAYMKIFQDYDIKKERDGESRPFSDITLDMELDLNNFFTLDMDLSWSPYDKDIKTLNIRNTLKDNRGDSLRAEYRYDKDEKLKSLYSRIDVSITDELSTYYSVEKNLMTKRTLENQIGFTIKKSCWALNLYFSESQDDQNIAFQIIFNGIGEFGTK